MSDTKLLIVEDNDGLREQMFWALQEHYTVLQASSTSECMNVFEREKPKMVCLDMGLDNIPTRGLEVIDQVLAIDRLAKIVVITAHTSETLGSDAIERGAFDYLRKPVDIDELKVILARAERILTMEKTDEVPKEASLESQPGFEMVGESRAMKKVFEMVKRLSGAEVNVLVTGESGTGKEVCARAIHFHSMRKDQPFVPINCSAIPETLLESELFGYTKGAFTGANSDKRGLIEAANGGTLFLDEIGDMPKHLQAKLLRFIEDQRFQRLGDVTFLQANVRIIAATNRQVTGDDQQGGLRTDLYYRLSEFEINLPPLRDRQNDIVLLAERIIDRNRTRFGQPKLKLSSRARQLLLSYSWPGNVRELENKLNRAAISCLNQTIEPDDLQLTESSLTNLSFKDARNMFEKNFLVNVLKYAQYNVSEAARSAGLSRPTLYDMMRRHGITIKANPTVQMD